MTRDEIAKPISREIEPSRAGIDIAVLIAAILATQFVTGGYHAHRLTWLHGPALAAIVYALTLHFGHQRPSIPSPKTRVFFRGYMLASLALSLLIVSARWGFPIASFPEAPNNQLHSALRVVVAVPCSILIVIGLCWPLLSRDARSAPSCWLATALNLILISSTAIRLHHLPFL